MLVALLHDLVYSATFCMQSYMSELNLCLGQMGKQMDSNVEARLHQLTLEAFMLGEQSFKMRALDNNAKAMTLCRQQLQPIPEHVYAHLLVSQSRDNSQCEKSVQ